MFMHYIVVDPNGLWLYLALSLSSPIQPMLNSYQNLILLYFPSFIFLNFQHFFPFTIQINLQNWISPRERESILWALYLLSPPPFHCLPLSISSEYSFYYLVIVMKGFSACLACSVNLPPVYPTPSSSPSSPSSSPPFPVESSFSKQLVKELSKVAVAAAASIVSRTASGTWWTDDKVLPQLQQFKVAARQREREREWDRRLPGDRGSKNSLWIV